MKKTVIYIVTYDDAKATQTEILEQIIEFLKSRKSHYDVENITSKIERWTRESIALLRRLV